MITVIAVAAVTVVVAMVAMAFSSPDVSERCGREWRALWGAVWRFLTEPRFRVAVEYHARHRQDGTGSPNWKRVTA